MTKFSSIGGASAQKEPINAASAAAQTAAPAPDTVSADDAPTAADVHVDGLGSFNEFWNDDREVKGGDAAQPDGTATDGPEGAARPKAKKTWYQRLFGNDEGEIVDGPEAMDTEASEEMYRFGGQMAADLTDMMSAKVNHTLNATGTELEYRAPDEGRAKMASAWELWMRWKKVQVTPTTFLIFTWFTWYGMRFVFGMFAYMDRIRLYGFHWPWSDAWKLVRARKLGHDRPAFRTAADPAPQPAPAAPAMHVVNEPEPPAHTEPPAPPAAPAPPDPAIAAYAWKQCKQTGKPFRPGMGYPRTSKKTPELIDSFIDESAFISYKNSHGMIGIQSNKTKQDETA